MHLNQWDSNLQIVIIIMQVCSRGHSSHESNEYNRFHGDDHLTKSHNYAVIH